jgi:hypothetical protein
MAAAAANTACSPCAKGKFQPNSQATSCDLCSPGKAADALLQAQCSTCAWTHSIAFVLNPSDDGLAGTRRRPRLSRTHQWQRWVH